MKTTQSQTRSIRPGPSRLRPLAVAVAVTTIHSLAAPAPVRAADAASPFVGPVTASPYYSEKVPGLDYPWSTLRPDDLGPMQVEYDTTGMRKLPALPPAGVHPRIYFTPEQLPEISERLRNTRVGRHMYNAVLSYSHLLRGTYDKDADYAKTKISEPTGWPWKEGYAELMRYPFLNNGDTFRAWAEGNADYDAGKECGFVWGLFPLDALRCMVEKDETGGRELGRAVETAMRSFYETEAGKKNFKGGVEAQHFNIALTYDMTYNWLTPEGRKLLERFLTEFEQKTQPVYGCFQNAETTTSNWTSFSAPLITMLGLEGLPAFNDLRYRAFLRAYRNFYTYGWYDSGTCYEGMGKNCIGGDSLALFALRGENLAGHPHAKAHVTKRLAGEFVPGKGGKYFQYGRWGGWKSASIIDVVGMKYLYPDDPAIDWVYRERIGYDDPEWRIGRESPTFANNMVFALAVLATEPLAERPTPEAVNGGKKSFFCGERNLLTTRSDWSKDALYLNFHARPANGGHVFADRNSFHLNGAGETWAQKRPIAYKTSQANVVIIDGMEQSPRSPARMVDYVDTPFATFAVGDTTYTWQWNVVDRHTWLPRLGNLKMDMTMRMPAGLDVTPQWETANDFSYTDRDTPFYNEPLYYRPWFCAEPPTVQWDLFARELRLPMVRSFRTAGMVRAPEEGGPAYALVVDDIAVDDDKEHTFDWTMQLDDKTNIWKVDESRSGNAFTRDLHLFKPKTKDQTEPAPGDPVLLVRLLDEGGGAENSLAKIAGIAEVAPDPKKPKEIERRLIISTKSREADLKVLLYAYRLGEDPLPVTTATGKHSLQVAWPDKPWTDTLTFSRADTGKLDLAVERDGQLLAAVNTPVPPSPLRDGPQDGRIIYDNQPGVPESPKTPARLVKEFDFLNGTDLRFECRHNVPEPSVGDGEVVLDAKGNQIVHFEGISLPSVEAFSITFAVQLTENPEGATPKGILLEGAGWKLHLFAWDQFALGAPGKDDSSWALNRELRKEGIKELFVDNPARLALVKTGDYWIGYLNGKAALLARQKEEFTAGDPFVLKAGQGLTGRLIGPLRVYEGALTPDQVEKPSKEIQ